LVVAARGGIQNPGDFGQPARILKTLLFHENVDVELWQPESEDAYFVRFAGQGESNRTR
jgi:hypothetical protein